MSIFEQIKEHVTMLDAGKFYGLEVNRSGMCRCPFHNDKTPSMKLYDTGYHCFGCNAHGDVIGFTAKLFGISQLEAVQKLNYDFGLHIDTYTPLTQAQIIELHQHKQAIKDYTDWEKSAWLVLVEYYKLLNAWRESYVPHSPDESINIHFAESLNNLDYAEYICSNFIIADKNEKIAMKDEVKRIEQKLYNYRRDEISIVDYREKRNKRSSVL